MKQLQILVVLASLFLTLAPISLFAQTEDLKTMLEGPSVKDVQDTSEQVPNPLALKPTWWSYFEGDSKTLGIKINKFLTLIEELQSTVRDERKATTSGFITRIKASLNALLEINKTQSKTDLEQTPFIESYTFDEIIKLDRSLRELKSLNNAESQVFKDTLKATKALTQNIDTLNVAYRKLDTASQKKLVAGLEIMASRLAWFVSTLKEPILKNQLKQLDARINKLTNEIEHAQAKLIITEKDLNEINKNIDEQIFKLKEAKNYLNDAQSNTLEIVEEDLISNLKSSLLRQKALLAEIQVAREEVQLNNMQAKQSVANIMLQVPGVSAAELVDKYNKRDSLLKDIRVQYEVWHSSLMKEINFLIETVSDQDDANNVGKITSERKDTVRDVAIALRELGSSIGDLSFFSGVERKLLAKTEGTLFKIRSDSTYTFGQLWKKTQSVFTKSLFGIGDVPVTAADIFRALSIVLIAYIISRIVRKVLTRISTPADGRTSPVIYTLSRLSHYLILIIGLMIALTSIGLNFTNVAIVAGALSVGIGFGLQSIVNNFVSGIIILFEQNIKVGDFVQLDSGMNGIVKGSNVRSTVITTLDNLDIIVPNSELVTAKVVNYTMNEPMFRIHVPFGVAYGSDKTIVVKAGLEAAKNVEVTYDDGAKRRPQVWLTGFGDSSLNFELIVWVVSKKDSHATPGSWKALYVWEIETALEKYGIAIPFPQRDLHLKSGFVTT